MDEVQIEVTNVYPADGSEVVTHPAALVPAPGEDLDAWAEQHLLPLTGTGRTEGDAGYFVRVVRFDARPDLVGMEFEWGV